MVDVILVAPPFDAATQRRGAAYIDIDKGGWIERTYDVEDIPLAEIKATALAEIARRRWGREISGIVVSGRLVDTGREARTMLDQAARLGYAGAWKFADGSFAVVGPTDLAAMVQAAMAHTAACFAAEATAAAAINAAETLDDVRAALDAFGI